MRAGQGRQSRAGGSLPEKVTLAQRLGGREGMSLVPQGRVWLFQDRGCWVLGQVGASWTPVGWIRACLPASFLVSGHTRRSPGPWRSLEASPVGSLGKLPLGLHRKEGLASPSRVNLALAPAGWSPWSLNNTWGGSKPSMSHGKAPTGHSYALPICTHHRFDPGRECSRAARAYSPLRDGSPQGSSHLSELFSGINITWKVLHQLQHKLSQVPRLPHLGASERQRARAQPGAIPSSSGGPCVTPVWPSAGWGGSHPRTCVK